PCGSPHPSRGARTWQRGRVLRPAPAESVTDHRRFHFLFPSSPLPSLALPFDVPLPALPTDVAAVRSAVILSPEPAAPSAPRPESAARLTESPTAPTPPPPSPRHWRRAGGVFVLSSSRVLFLLGPQLFALLVWDFKRSPTRPDTCSTRRSARLVRRCEPWER